MSSQPCVIPAVPRIIGSISTGTLRPEDVLPKMMETLRVLNSATHSLIQDQNGELLDSLPNLEPGELSDDISWLWYRIADAIDDNLPEGWSFGSHPGDGTDFGIWREEEEDGPVLDMAQEIAVLPREDDPDA